MGKSSRTMLPLNCMPKLWNEMGASPIFSQFPEPRLEGGGNTETSENKSVMRNAF